MAGFLGSASANSAGKRRARLRRCLLAAIGVLYLISVPWYRESGAAPELLLGLPDWVAVAVGCYFAAAVLNAMAWLLTDVSDDGNDAAADGESGGRRP